MAANQREESVAISQSVVNLDKLESAISKGIIAGTAGVVTSFATESSKRHDLRNTVDQTMQKVYDLDREVVLLKGMMTSLIGKGDGETGMVPRLERDMSSLGKEMTEVKTEVQELRADVASVKEDVQAIRAAQANQTSFTDGWRGVGVFLGIMATVISIVGGTVLGIIWLYRH